MTPSVLVTDGEQRAALAAVRSLGRAGHRVFVCGSAERSLAAASRYARGSARVPDPLTTPGPYVEGVDRLIRSWEIEVLLPVTEPSHLALLPVADRWPAVRLPAPDFDRFSRIHDKPALLDVAARLGITVPSERRIGWRADPDELQGLEFPVVVKPGRSVPAVGTKLAVRLASDLPDLERCLGTLPEAAFPILLQQRIVGPGVGIFLLRWAGRWLAVFAHRRLREKPPWGGVSVYRESVEPPPGLVELSRRLLEAYEWEGVAMVEYKIDRTTGEAHLMEVNGRLWGSLQLAIDAGVDFPRLLVEAVLGEHVAPVRTFKVGVRSRWWLGDLDHLIACLRRRPAIPDGGCRSRARELADFLKLWRPGDRNEVLRLSDPLPFGRETLDWLRDALARGGSRHRSVTA